MDIGTEAQDYFIKHWDTGFEPHLIGGTSGAAALLGMNKNTLKTRLARGQAMVLRTPAGEVRSTISFTGFHLVYNLIHDRLLRYGFSVEKKEMDSLVYSYAEAVKEKVLTGEDRDPDLAFEFRLSEKGSDELLAGYFNYTDQRDLRDATLIVPVGKLVNQMATTLKLKAMLSEAAHSV